MVLIDRHDSPRISSAGARCLSRIPFARCRMRRRVGERIEAPAQRARACIERANDPALDVGGAVVTDRRADDQKVASNGRRRGDLIEVAVADAQPLCQVDLATRAEIHARLAGLSIQGDQPRIESAGENATRTWLCLLLGVGLFPHGYASGRALAVVPGSVNVRIVSPTLTTGFRVERDHDVRPCFYIKGAEGKYRCCFKREFARPHKPCAELARAVGPGDLEVRDVLAVYLVETRVVFAEGVAAVVAPIARVGRLRERSG